MRVTLSLSNLSEIENESFTIAVSYNAKKERSLGNLSD